MIKAVIFDMDGLLIDSEPFWNAAHKKLLEKHGISITDRERQAQSGRRTDEITAHWRERFKLERVSSEEMAEEVIADVEKAITEKGQSLPGAKSLVNLLQDKQIHMAVASSSPQRLIEAVLEKLQLTDAIEDVHSAWNEKRGKPFPDVFLTTAKELGVEPESCLVFEDSPNGVKAAKAAGMKCIAVPEAHNPYTLFTEADIIVNSLEDITWAMMESLFRPAT